MTKPTPRFLCHGSLAVASEVELSPEESHHLARVLRLDVRAHVSLVNGTGSVAEAVIVEASAKRARCVVNEVRVEPIKNRITLAFAIPKSGALDFIIHRCTELGVSAFQPIVSKHSMAASAWNEERWNRIIIEVSKQCQESHFPTLSSPQPLGAWIRSRKTDRDMVFCDEGDRSGVITFKPGFVGLDLLIGCEGGWSEEDRDCFKNIGHSLGLGPNRLRAETSSIVALSLLKKLISEI